MFWGFRLALPLTGGSDPGGLCPPIGLMRVEKDRNGCSVKTCTHVIVSNTLDVRAVSSALPR